MKLVFVIVHDQTLTPVPTLDKPEGIEVDMARRVWRKTWSDWRPWTAFGKLKELANCGLPMELLGVYDLDNLEHVNCLMRDVWTLAKSQ